MKPKLLLVLFFLLAFFTPNQVSAQTSADWYMAGANPQRTSWVASTAENQTEIRGVLRPLWYRSLEPYISRKAQIIAISDRLYISSAKGLYVLYTGDDGIHPAGSLAWIYPSDLPFDNAPTVYRGVVYVAGLDHQIHALNAQTGQVIWIYKATNPEGLTAGFQTNPLVIDNQIDSSIPVGQGKLYAGNRDGYLYAVNIETNPGTLVWQTKLKGPIAQSAAYQDGVVYVTTAHSYAYALNANSGQIIWESAQLPGGGFYSYWPVIYRDYLLLAGSFNYQYGGVLSLDGIQYTANELKLVYKNNSVPYGERIGPIGTVSGDWAVGTRTIDASLATDYFETYPHKRTFFVLNRNTGQEYSFDSDNDNRQEYAPILYTGTHSGNRFPPLIGVDGVSYIQNNYISDEWIARGGVSGWKFGSEIISEVEQNINAVDEPMYYSAGGKMVYWDLTCDREAGGFDITMPYSQSNREWNYYNYNLDSLIPGFDSLYPVKWGDRCGAYGISGAGVYGSHGLGNPPIPYKGKLYLHKSNSIIALAVTSQTAQRLSQINISPSSTDVPLSTKDQLRTRLSQEISKMMVAGHLRPGYLGSGLSEFHAHDKQSYIVEYFNNPAETYSALIKALPYLDVNLQNQVKTYLQQEFNSYPLYNTALIGYKNGAKRESQQTLPEIQNIMNNNDRTSGYWLAGIWQFPQNNYYYLWKYAQVFGNASSLFNQIRSRLETPPGDSILLDYPQVHNGFIAGYIGYLELQKLAGESETASVRSQLNRMLELRSSTFADESPGSMLLGSANFVNMVPELADYLRINSLSKVSDFINIFNKVAPSWFVSRYDATIGEGAIHLPLDSFAQFQARAYILKQPYEELAKYLDVPAFETGDLYYLQNLIAALEAPYSGATPTPIPTLSCSADIDNNGSVGMGDILTVIAGWLTAIGDLNSDSKINGIDLGYVLREWGRSCN